MTPKFNIEKKGYDKLEVDVYIDRIRSEYEKVTRELKDVSSELESLLEANRRLEARLREQESSVKDRDDIAQAMITAQSYARRAEQDAAERSDMVIRDAEAKAANMLADAQAKASEMLDEAESKAGEIVRLAHHELDDIQDKVQLLYRQILPLVERGAEGNEQYAVPNQDA